MEDKKQLAPTAMPDMNRSVSIKVGVMYHENGLRKLNLVISNNIENVYNGLVDLQKLFNTLDSSSKYTIAKGSPGQPGFAIEGAQNSLSMTMASTAFGSSRKWIELDELSPPNYISGKMKAYRGNRTYTSLMKITLSNQENGKVLVMMTSQESGTSFWENIPSCFLLPCFLPIYCTYDFIPHAYGIYFVSILRKYLSNAGITQIPMGLPTGTSALPGIVSPMQPQIQLMQTMQLPPGTIEVQRQMLNAYQSMPGSSLLSSKTRLAIHMQNEMLNNLEAQQEALQAQAQAVQATPVQAEIIQAIPASTQPDPVQQLVELKKLLDAGALTQEEYQSMKSKLIQ